MESTAVRQGSEGVCVRIWRERIWSGCGRMLELGLTYSHAQHTSLSEVWGTHRELYLYIIWDNNEKKRGPVQHYRHSIYTKKCILNTCCKVYLVITEKKAFLTYTWHMPWRQLKLCQPTLTSSWGKGPLEFSGKLIGGITQSLFCLCRWPLCFVACLGNTISSISCDSFALKYKTLLSARKNIFWKTAVSMDTWQCRAHCYEQENTPGGPLLIPLLK